MDYKTWKLEQFIKKYCNNHNEKVRFLRNIFVSEEHMAEEMVDFLSSTISEILECVPKDRDVIQFHNAWNNRDVIPLNAGYMYCIDDFHKNLQEKVK